MAALFFLSNCGGGGSSSTGAANKATLSGTASDDNSSSKPNHVPESFNQGDNYPRYNKITDWSGATIEIINSAGEVIGTTTANIDGTYTVSVDPGTNYIIRISKGNLVLKAIVDSVTTSSAKTVNVNPTTTAVVKVIAQIIGNTNLGEKGENVTTQIANRNISTDITSITSHTSFTIIVTAIVQEIETKYDPNSTTTAIGSVSTTGVTEAIIIAIFITTSPPSAPTGVTASAGDGQITITWTSVSDTASYNIYSSTASGVTKLTGTKLTNVTSPYTNTGLTNGTTYYYVITAVNSYGESSESSQVSATPSTTTTGTTPDTTAPTVSLTNPSNNATGVAINSSISASFSETMNSSTITTSTVTVGQGLSLASGTVSYSGTTATFTPSSNLSYGTTYTATITTGVQDSAGNAMASTYTWSFTTGNATDTTAPTVSLTNPSNNTTGVAINSAIAAAFSETMQASTITTSTFTIGGVSGTVSYSGTTATFTPSTNLSYGTTYTATITTGVQDSAGNAMASSYSWIFTTVS